jgi:DNA-binding MarR family transcriptional regulator
MDGLNPLIHQPTRLHLMASLVSLEQDERADFVFLRDLLNLTDGNLSTHLLRLEEAGYVSVEKTFEGRRPKTWIRATDAGREAFDAHVSALERILHKH